MMSEVYFLENLWVGPIYSWQAYCPCLAPECRDTQTVPLILIAVNLYFFKKYCVGRFQIESGLCLDE